MWTQLNEIGDLLVVNADRSEEFKMFLALAFANKISVLAKVMVPREEQASVNQSQAQDCWRWLDSYRPMGPDSL